MAFDSAISRANGYSGLVDGAGNPFRNGFGDMVGDSIRPRSGYDGFALPTVLQFAATVGSVRGFYRDSFDEAMRNSRESAIVMEHDTGLMGPLQERMLACVSLPWHIHVPDEKDPIQKAVKDHLTKTIENMVGPEQSILKMRMNLLWGIWYGRQGAKPAWSWVRQSGVKTLTLADWMPLRGDKIATLKDLTPTVDIYAAAADYEFPDSDITTTTNGARALVLHGNMEWGWRSRVIIHRHELIDADFFDALAAEAAMGLGVRSRVFWLDWISREWLARTCDWVDRVGMGVNLWYYDASNNSARLQAESAAKAMTDRTNILVPRWGNDKFPALERIEVPTGGAQLLLQLRQDIREQQKLYIIGQTMSTGGDNIGGDMGGSNRAKLASGTKDLIRNFDAKNLDATMTGSMRNPGIVSMIQYHTFPSTWPSEKNPDGFRASWVSDLEDSESMERLQAGTALISIPGMTLKMDELRSAGGFSKPVEGDEIAGTPLGAAPGGISPDGSVIPSAGGAGFPGAAPGAQPAAVATTGPGAALPAPTGGVTAPGVAAPSAIGSPSEPPEREEYEGDEDEPKLEPFEHPEHGPVLRDPKTGEIFRGDQPPEDEEETVQGYAGMWRPELYALPGSPEDIDEYTFKEPKPAAAPASPAPVKPIAPVAPKIVAVQPAIRSPSSGRTYIHGPEAAGQALIAADPWKLDEVHRRSPDYIPPKGSLQVGTGGEVPGRRAKAEEFIKTGAPIHAPEAFLESNGNLTFEDGNHRFAALRDLGETHIGLSVPQDQAERFRQLFAPNAIGENEHYALNEQSPGAAAPPARRTLTSQLGARPESLAPRAAVVKPIDQAVQPQVAAQRPYVQPPRGYPQQGAVPSWQPHQTAAGVPVWRHSTTGIIRRSQAMPADDPQAVHDKHFADLMKPPATDVYPFAKSEIEQRAGELLPGYPVDQLHRLAGAQPGMIVTPHATTQFSGAAAGAKALNLRVHGPQIDPDRGTSQTIYQHPDGSLVSYQNVTAIRKKFRGGLGARLFADRAKELAAAGVDRIENHAARGQGWNGYATWPKLGYDAPLPSHMQASLPRGLQGAKTVLDLHQTPEGEAWWKKHGDSIDMKFDLTPGSRSWQKLNAYRESKGLPAIDLDPAQVQATRDTRKMGSVHVKWAQHAEMMGHDPAAVRAEAEGIHTREESDPEYMHYHGQYTPGHARLHGAYQRAMSLAVARRQAEQRTPAGFHESADEPLGPSQAVDVEHSARADAPEAYGLNLPGEGQPQRRADTGGGFGSFGGMAGVAAPGAAPIKPVLKAAPLMGPRTAAALDVRPPQLTPTSQAEQDAAKAAWAAAGKPAFDAGAGRAYESWMSHPLGMEGQRKDEPDDAFRTRLEQHRQQLLQGPHTLGAQVAAQEAARVARFREAHGIPSGAGEQLHQAAHRVVPLPYWYHTSLPPDQRGGDNLKMALRENALHKEQHRFVPAGAAHDLAAVPEELRGGQHHIEPGYFTTNGEFVTRPEAARRKLEPMPGGPLAPLSKTATAPAAQVPVQPTALGPTPTAAMTENRPLPPPEKLNGMEWRTNPQRGNLNPSFTVRSPAGERYFAKAPQSPFTGEPSHVDVGNERAANEILRRIGVPHVPAMTTHQRGGAPHLVTPHIEGQDLSELAFEASEGIPEAKRQWQAIDRRDLANTALGNWLINADDRHRGNYRVTTDNRVVPIDYGASFHPHQNNAPNWGYNDEALTHSGLLSPQQPLDKATIQRILDARQDILKSVEQHVLPHFDPRPDAPYSQKSVLDTLAEKFNHLRGLLAKPTPTVADLPRHKTQNGQNAYDLISRYDGPEKRDLEQFMQAERGGEIGTKTATG